jgi:sulfatase modifying factor 1
MGQHGLVGSTPEHTVLLDPACLDTFEVTVGRFRKFVEAYQVPTEGVGAHSKVPNSGWRTAWASLIAPDAAQLRSNLDCGKAYQTWTADPGGNEALPINCVTWFEAFAFCAWDGGRLPSEAEWEFASTGGHENRPYPWGLTNPDDTLANYCQSMMVVTCNDSPQFVSPGGTTPLGKARWEHQDLGGNVWEWTKDWFSEGWYGNPGCTNCINTDAPGTTCIPAVGKEARVARGGSFNYPKDAMQAYHRGCNVPTYRNHDVGFRCIRDLP